jgi:hypothetical protein
MSKKRRRICLTISVKGGSCIWQWDMYGRSREKDGKRAYKMEKEVLSVTILKKEHVCSVTSC